MTATVDTPPADRLHRTTRLTPPSQRACAATVSTVHAAAALPCLDLQLVTPLAHGVPLLAPGGDEHCSPSLSLDPTHHDALADTATAASVGARQGRGGPLRLLALARRHVSRAAVARQHALEQHDCGVDVAQGPPRGIAMTVPATKHSTAQHSTAQHSTAQHSTAQHSTAQHSTAQHSTSLSLCSN